LAPQALARLVVDTVWVEYFPALQFEHEEPENVL
jgi:hypothetical protein